MQVQCVLRLSWDGFLELRVVLRRYFRGKKEFENLKGIPG